MIASDFRLCCSTEVFFNLKLWVHWHSSIHRMGDKHLYSRIEWESTICNLFNNKKSYIIWMHWWIFCLRSNKVSYSVLFVWIAPLNTDKYLDHFRRRNWQRRSHFMDNTSPLGPSERWVIADDYKIPIWMEL